MEGGLCEQPCKSAYESLLVTAGVPKKKSVKSILVRVSRGARCHFAEKLGSIEGLYKRTKWPRCETCELKPSYGKPWPWSMQQNHYHHSSCAWLILRDYSPGKMFDTMSDELSMARWCPTHQQTMENEAQVQKAQSVPTLKKAKEVNRGYCL